MKIVTQFLSTHTAEALGWMLVNSIWQALIIMIVIIVVIKFIPAKFSRARYATVRAGLFLLLVSCASTFMFIASEKNETVYHHGTTSFKTITNSSSVALSLILNETSFSNLLSIIKNVVDSNIPLIIAFWIVGSIAY